MDNSTTLDQGVTIQSTRDYDAFHFMVNNRSQKRGHIEALRQAFQETGNLTKVQPILVNDRMQIIDGQHRFVAARELGVPIYYTMVAGLGIHEAREMNILHRSWDVTDFAQSFATSGDPNYQKYLQLREDYGTAHATTIAYVLGEDKKGMYAEFRRGEFVIPDEQVARDRLQKLVDVSAYAPMWRDKFFAFAFLQIISSEDYDHQHMLNKLESYGERMLRRYGSIAEYLRALEELYNHNQKANRTRLY